jgi:hypothetical protein
MVHSKENVTEGAMSTDERMTVDERRKYLRTMQKRYEQADRRGKSQLLNLDGNHALAKKGGESVAYLWWVCSPLHIGTPIGARSDIGFSRARREHRNHPHARKGIRTQQQVGAL